MTAGLVSDGVLRWAERAPERAAIHFSSDIISYGHLATHIHRVASAVDAAQARRVAVSLNNHPALLELFFGVTLAGGAFLLFEPTWPRTIFEAMISAHEPQLTFTRSEFEKYVAWRDGQGLARALRSQPTPDMPFLIGFTSGTTGTPKAFIRSHASWAASFAASRQEFGTHEHTHVLLPGPLSHGLSLYAAVETLNAGGSVTIAPTFDAKAFMQLARNGVVNTIVAAPTLLDVMIDCASAVPEIKCIITAGAKLSGALRKKLSLIFPHARISEYYGASELSFVSVAHSNEDCPPESVGRAFAGVQIKIENGVVWIRSDMVSNGYVGHVDDTGFRTHGGWATVGDQGSLDAQGFLTLAGREGDMIITGGLNVYPAEVEAVLAQVTGVAEVLVTGEHDERWGQVVTAIVSPRSADFATLKSFCDLHLAKHKRPRRWFVTDQFKHTPSGKIDRADTLAKLRSAQLKALT